MLASILGTAESFAVLAGTPNITNTGSTTITGNVGISPAASITGKGPGADQITLTGAYHEADAVALTAKNNLTTAYTALNNMPASQTLVSNELGGLTLTPGVYAFQGNPAAVLLTAGAGTLTLDAQNNNNAFWVFQIPNALTTSVGSSVIMTNFGSNGGSDNGLFWAVGSSASIFGSTLFEGNILAYASITIDNSATILNGRALAQTGTVTMDTNTISIICPLGGPGNGGPGYSGGLEFDDEGNVVPLNSVHGYKFNDLNANGQDDGEPRLAGWTIELVVTDGQGNPVSTTTTTTGADGEYSFTGLVGGTYMVSERTQAGWTQMAGGATFTLGSGQEVVAYAGEAGTLLPGQVEVLTEGLAFGNFLLLQTSINGMKFNDLNANGVQDANEPGLAGWTIYVDYDADSVLDPGESSAVTGVGGAYTITGVDPGSWIVREVGQTGWTNSFPATSEPVTVPSNGSLSGINFGNWKHSVIVIGSGKSPRTPQFVTVIDEVTGAVLAQFAPYGNAFQGGVRVATGDLTGDGIDEIVTAPGWSIVAEVHVYTQDGILLRSFQPYGSTFKGGVQVAVGDVDGDGLNDIITVPNWGAAEVKVFQNVLDGDGKPTFDASDPYRDFLAFPASFIGGAVVAAADMGSTPLPNGPFDTTQQDQRAEIVVGSGGGMKTTVKVFDVSGLTPLTPGVIPTAAGSFTPFSTNTTNYKGGVSLSVARINADPVPDIVVGAGANGGSLVDVWAWDYSSSATLSSLSENGIGFAAFDGASQPAPVQVAALDTVGDEDIADAILAVQGPGGTTGQIRVFNITSVSPWLEVSLPTEVPGGFPGAYLGPYFIATISDASPALPLVTQAAAGGEGNVAPNPYDINGDGGVTPLDVLILINYINSESDGQVTPLNVLVVINYINTQPQGTAGEGESVTTATSTSAIEIPVVSVGFILPAMESHWVDAETSASAPSVGQPDHSPSRVWSIPDTRTNSLPERGLLSPASDHAEPVDLGTDLLELDSVLTDIVLDIARSWNPSA